MSKNKKTVSHSVAKHIAHKTRKMATSGKLTDAQVAASIDAMFGEMGVANTSDQYTGNDNGILPLYSIAENIVEAVPDPSTLGDTAPFLVAELTSYGNISEPGAKECVQLLLKALPTSWTRTAEGQSITSQLQSALDAAPQFAAAD